MIPSLIVKEKTRRSFLKKAILTGLSLGIGAKESSALVSTDTQKEIRVGVIGLSVHSADFTEILNASTEDNELKGCRVVAVHHPPGNPDVEFSAERLREFSNRITNHGVTTVDSIDELIEQVDAVMLLTNDGRPHLEQVIPVLKAGKPVYIDKPLAASLSEVLGIFKASKQYGVPIFSSSALRYTKKAQDIRWGNVVGKVLGAEAYGPAPLEKSHVDLFWDGIHGVETLYTVMGRGCQWVTRTHVKGADVVVGTWKDERIGIFRGLRTGKIGFGGTVYGVDGIASIGPFGGYRPLVVAIVDFFRTWKPPVGIEETLEIYTFMAAADESKRRGGIPVYLSSVLSEAQKKIEKEG